MSVLFKVQNNKFKDGNLFNKRVICKTSSKNIVAFCISQDAPYFGTSNYVFVCDIISPWHFFKVTCSKSEVNILEWNATGELLVIGYRSGEIEIWSPHNQVLNSWSLVYKALLSNEEILDCKFFHNGKATYFNTLKRDMPIYTDKFERSDYRPSLTQFGSSFHEGCLILTSSGLLGAFIIPKLNHYGENAVSQPTLELNVTTQSIGLSRKFIATSSISHCSSGYFNIAISYGAKEHLLHCFKVSLAVKSDDSINIKCESYLNLFYLTTEPKSINHVRWAKINNDDIIWLAYSSAEGKHILEQWNLNKKPQSVHRVLQKNKGDFICTEAWESVSKVFFAAEISDVCISKLLCDFVRLYIVLKDNTVQILEPGLKKISAIGSERLNDDRQVGGKFVVGDVTWLNQILIVFDNYGNLYALQIPNTHHDKNFMHNTLSLQLSLLEYSITTGIDASDVLMLNLLNLDILIEKLTENFARQSAFTRHFYYSNFLSLKSNMCRIQSKQQDFDNLIMLHAISITFKSLLRPSDLSCHDKGPADNLAITLSEPLADVDKVLFNLDAKDFTVEPLTLQSLQQLIQWVTDLALTILKKLPEEVIKSKTKKQGYDISRDIVAISSIRELLVMIRIWGLLNSQCLPIYTKSVENTDVLSLLFRLLTRLAQNTSDPDEMLIDECSTLSTQILIPSKNFHPSTTLLNTHILMMKPLLFSTDKEPVGLQDVYYDEVVFQNGIKDGIYNINLGCIKTPVKKCNRCGCVNSMVKIGKTSALKSWCNRWIYCHCGGNWKLA
ncbi:mediator of RNA polymerase II transcription subunit 16-like [Teleopsis dalmanni]|uniref:mediator of RNA polymerase II transcription subunit 16-like n=1 Tax=Teleopsis dalmanni TaxID=139649 RepID=UPI0018CE4752|nr:mediator of RNA polymerase II transcription subunit 16-like [Teleopsis dalmanni]